MTNDLTKAQAIGEIIQKPKYYWAKDATAPLAGVHSAYFPVALVQVASTLTDITAVLLGSFSLGDPADASLSIYQLRDGSTINSLCFAFENSWASKTTSISSPGWELAPGDVLAVLFAQESPGVAVPSTLIVLTTEP